MNHWELILNLSVFWFVTATFAAIVISAIRSGNIDTRWDGTVRRGQRPRTFGVYVLFFAVMACLSLVASISLTYLCTK